MIKNKDFSSQIHAYHALINNLQNKYFVSPKLFVSRPYLSLRKTTKII